MRSLRVAATALAALTAAAIAQGAVADGHLEKAVKARQAQMQLYSFNLGQLGAMAKGDAAYDAKVASAAANNLAALASLDGSALWPQGSDLTAMPDKTAAKPEIWSTYPAIAEKGKALREASAALAAVAGDGLDALKANIGPVGKSCGGCHNDFRQKK